MSDRYNNGQQTAPELDALNNKDVARVPRSSFNYSRVTNFNGLIGAIMPFDVIYTLPNEDYNISYDVLALTRNPLVRRLQNGMKIYIHTYWSRNSDLWAGWKNFIDKGFSGKINKKIPMLAPHFSGTSVNIAGTTAGDCYTTRTPFSPSDYMGIPIEAYRKGDSVIKNWFRPTKIVTTGEGKNQINVDAVKNGKNKSNKWDENALKYAMYNKVYRKYYANINLLAGNKKWYPDNLEEWKIPYEWGADNADYGYVNCMNGYICDTQNYIKASDVENTESELYTPTGYGERPSQDEAWFNILHFRQFKGDYFTASSPFEDLIRGEAESIKGDTAELSLDPSLSALENLNSISDYKGIGANAGSVSSIQPKIGLQGITSASQLQNANENFNDFVSRILSKTKVENFTMSLNSLRKAIVLNKLKERNAQTSGIYSDMVNSWYGYRPKEHLGDPTYVGGTAQDIVFNEVVQTSETSNDSYLGKTGSRGISANSGYIGHFHSDDYGILMSVMTIVPDTYYSKQGIDALETAVEWEKQYIPIFCNLSADAILNKELKVTGTAKDKEVFAWKERFSEYKSRRNIINGLGSMGNVSLFDAQNYMRREFDETPTLTPNMLTLTPGNVDMKPFYSVNEPPFDIQVGCRIDKVSPMPYITKPMDFGASF